jgi:hypothetical protein
VSRHPSVENVVKWIDHAHLPEGLMREVSEKFTIIKDDLLSAIESDSPEVTAGFRKLLEAKDCFVRAAKQIEVQVKDAAADITRPVEEINSSVEGGQKPETD